MLVASALIVPVTLALSDVRPLLVVPAALAGGVVIGLFSSAIPYTTEIAALRRMPAATFGVLMSLEPAIAAGVGFVLLGQVLAPTDLLAIAWWRWPAPARACPPAASAPPGRARVGLAAGPRAYRL